MLHWFICDIDARFHSESTSGQLTCIPGQQEVFIPWQYSNLASDNQNTNLTTQMQKHETSIIGKLRALSVRFRSPSISSDFRQLASESGMNGTVRLMNTWSINWSNVPVGDGKETQRKWLGITECTFQALRWLNIATVQIYTWLLFVTRNFSSFLPSFPVLEQLLCLLFTERLYFRNQETRPLAKIVELRRASWFLDRLLPQVIFMNFISNFTSCRGVIVSLY